MTPLELFFKDNSHVAAHFRVSPHPSPHGEGQRLLNRLWSQWDSAILCLFDTPDFGRFSKARAATHITAALAENLPHRSREHEFSAGRVLRVKDTFVLKTSLTRVTGLNEWAAGAKCSLALKTGSDGLSHTDAGAAADL
jgi:hypothetical protein